MDTAREIAREIARDLAPTGPLRASINLGNPVLAHGSPENPSGIAVDIAGELGRRLGIAVELVCFGAALDSFEALRDGRADVCFLAIEPAREASVAFTAPYVIIEGVFVVPEDSPIRSVEDADRPGMRIGVKKGSAYDLFLTRTLAHAEVVRGSEGSDVFTEQHLEVAAGIRAPMAAFAGAHPGLRVVEPRFMEIRQAVGTSPGKAPQTLEFLRSSIEDLKRDGFVAAALRRAGRDDAAVAPLAPSAV